MSFKDSVEVAFGPVKPTMMLSLSPSPVIVRLRWSVVSASLTISVSVPIQGHVSRNISVVKGVVVLQCRVAVGLNRHVRTVKLALSGTPTSVNSTSASAVKADAKASLIVTVAEPFGSPGQDLSRCRFNLQGVFDRGDDGGDSRDEGVLIT